MYLNPGSWTSSHFLFFFSATELIEGTSNIWCNSDSRSDSDLQTQRKVRLHPSLCFLIVWGTATNEQQPPRTETSGGAWIRIDFSLWWNVGASLLLAACRMADRSRQNEAENVAFFLLFHRRIRPRLISWGFLTASSEPTGSKCNSQLETCDKSQRCVKNCGKIYMVVIFVLAAELPAGTRSSYLFRTETFFQRGSLSAGIKSFTLNVWRLLASSWL